ncbi:MAG: hypothetical protein II740_09590 [Lachnospiraceae bacterium]|nr:hypothetical protein [Lachnospiraceae bacterium]
MDFSVDLRKQNNDIAVGFDLTDSYSQVSYASMDSDEVETLSTVPGSNNYRVPTALFKRKEVNQWYAGKDALKYKDTDGFFIDNLISKASLGEDIVVGEETFSPSALIALFMKRTLSLFSMMIPINHITSFVVTVDSLDSNIIDVLSKAVASLGLKTTNVFFQSHMESFYYYTIYQPQELWQRDVLLLDFTGEYLKSYRMECNKNTTPIVAFIDPGIYRNFLTGGLENIDPESRDARDYDFRLSNLLEDICSARFFSSVYFIGDAFRQEVFTDSVKKMCQKGRVFEGTNLYSKGAAYAAKNKIFKSALSESHVFLGNDKLKCNVGINAIRRGEPSYMALMDAGVNWFESKKQYDFILDKGNKVSFVITPLTGKNPEAVDITLNDLPKRPPKTTRLHLEVSMLSENKMQVEIKDMGFGELFPSSCLEWKEVIEL